MDDAGAAELTDAWMASHRPEDAPSTAAAEGVRRLLAERVPDAAFATALTDAEGRRRVAALAGGALYLVWAVKGNPEAARCRRIPLEPAAVEVSERAADGGRTVRHWWFEVGDEPLVFQVLDDADDAFASALASALGWRTR